MLLENRVLRGILGSKEENIAIGKEDEMGGAYNKHGS
jgi:hypothetical protein